MTDSVRSAYRFARLPEWILYHRDLNELAVRVYCVLDRFDGRDCFPSLEAIGAKFGKSQDAVRRAIRALESAGALLVEARSTEDGRQTSNRYFLAGDSPISPRESATPDPGRNATLPPRESATRTRAMKNESNKNTTQHQPAADGRGLDDWFGRFWAIYPRKVQKKAAERAMRASKKLTGPATFMEMMDGLEKRIAWWQAMGTPMDKIPHPATWLNGERWFDEIEAVTVQQGRSRPSADEAFRDKYEDLAGQMQQPGFESILQRMERRVAESKPHGAQPQSAGELAP